jgi:vacuolar protein sorting-associated protein 13A/C
VLDAGHISIESDLANKDAIQEIKTKRNQQYTDEDFRRLESLMYDKVLVSLHSAQASVFLVMSESECPPSSQSHIFFSQLLVGEDLDQCLSALSSERSGSKMHLLEHIDLDFLVQLSMVADALNLTRFKISGKLPTLAINISNSKYKGLMRIIDISIPHFDDYEGGEINDGDNGGIGTYHGDRDVSGAMLSGGDFRLPSTLFGGSEGPEYVVEDDDGAQTDADIDERFFEAQEHSTEVSALQLKFGQARSLT